MTAELTAAELEPFDLFAELDAGARAQWAAAATVRELAAGETVSEPGGGPALFQIILEGTAEAFVIEDGRTEPVGEHVAPTFIGAIAALTGDAIGVRMIASTPMRVASITSDQFVELALAHRSVFRQVMARVRPVMGRITSLEQNRERLASLGTMAAGLAHELNNPAAAARRAASALADALDVLGSTIEVFVESGVERAEAAELVALQRQAMAAAHHGPVLGTLEAADAEDALADHLAAAGVSDGWRLAEPLARAGVDADFVDRVAGLAGPATAAALGWIAASLSARELAAELADSTERMSGLVKAVKRYAYMDRGDLVAVDLHEGLDTTLTILGHKLKHTRISVTREYDESLPTFLGRGAELNQVWTNLLDNAIDALGETGHITIRTRLDGGCAEVDIADDGPGIPDEARERIFDPFFTTKDVGQGTGLGLDTARRIIVDRHHGSLTVESAPGRTVFRARLPLQPA